MKKKVCPKCKSVNVRKKMGVLLAIGVPQEWKCNDCGYSNFIFPELKEKLEKENEKNKNLQSPQMPEM